MTGVFFQAWIRACDDLLHHTEEWRRNANRARRRDNNAELANGTESGNKNGNANGFDNLALDNEDEK